MRAAHASACSALDAEPEHPAREAWGWHGRTLGTPVTTPRGPAWLRVACAPTSTIISTFWNGAVDAQRSLPKSIPRPQLLRWHDWTSHTWAYRAELHDHVGTPTAAPHAVITTSLDLPATWWTAMRAALDTIATVPTNRVTIQPGFLAWAMPHYLGISASDHLGPAWTTAHGDFHLANLCAPRLTILDWEGWGLAPPSYDAATLHSYSLLAPDTATQINRELAHLLDTTTGQHAELIVITELLHTADQGINPTLTRPLRHRAETILGRSTT